MPRGAACSLRRDRGCHVRRVAPRCAPVTHWIHGSRTASLVMGDEGVCGLTQTLEVRQNSLADELVDQTRAEFIEFEKDQPATMGVCGCHVSGFLRYNDSRPIGREHRMIRDDVARRKHAAARPCDRSSRVKNSACNRSEACIASCCKAVSRGVPAESIVRAPPRLRSECGRIAHSRSVAEFSCGREAETLNSDGQCCSRRIAHAELPNRSAAVRAFRIAKNRAFRSGLRPACSFRWAGTSHQATDARARALARATHAVTATSTLRPSTRQLISQVSMFQSLRSRRQITTLIMPLSPKVSANRT